MENYPVCPYILIMEIDGWAKILHGVITRWYAPTHHMYVVQKASSSDMKKLEKSKRFLKTDFNKTPFY